MKIIEQTSPWKPSNGDILFANKFIAGVAESVDNPLSLELYSINPWNTLDRLGIDCEPLKTSCRYRDPWSDNIYYWFVPTTIDTLDVSQYKPDREVTNSIHEMLFDTKYMKEHHYKDGLGVATGIEKSFLGHGYTSSTLPNDGHGKTEPVYLQLSNGDKLCGFLWIWYNK